MINNDNDCNSTSKFIQRASNTSALNQTTPRRSWSTFAFNNKNFPDGKLTDESSQGTLGATTKLFLNDSSEMNKFGLKDAKTERTNQDVMARASQIVM